jgi:RNA polymerase-associated protein CTR9
VGIDDYRKRNSKQQHARNKPHADDTEAFVGMSTALAAHQILEALRRGGDESLFEEATALLTEAERKDPLANALWLRKGLLLLAKRSLQAAEYQFSVCLSKDAGFVPARLGEACVLFCLGKWKDALSAFQSILRGLPSGPAELRLAVAACMQRLGFDEAAEGAFGRVLALRGGRDAVVQAGLGVIHLNRAAEEPGALASGLSLLKAAYEADRRNAVALTHLGNHFFFKQDFAKASTLLQAALSSRPDEAVEAEARFMLGKLAQHQGRLEEAHSQYTEAVTRDPAMTLAQYGLGQMKAARRDYASAIACFERVLERAPGSVESRRALGLLLASAATDDARQLRRAQECLRAVPEDFDVLLALGSVGLLLAGTSSGAFEAYLKASQLAPERFRGSPLLLNNLAVLHLEAGQRDEAQALLGEALGIARVGGETHDTLLYNRARLLESEGEDGAAVATGIYLEILKRRPGHIEAHLRLGLLAAAAGGTAEAQEHYKEAIGQDENCLEAWALLANTQLRLRALTPARKSFERMLGRIDRHDLYALVALGNIHTELARAERKAAEREAGLRRALEFFAKALGLEARNAAAANGVAMVLGELGRWAEAKEILLQVRQAQPENQDAALNLGHVLVELGQYGAAVNAYESVAAHAHSKAKVALLLFLGRALYLQGRAERHQPAQPLRRALEYLRQAEAYLPQDLPIRFNTALCLQELAAALIRTDGEEGGGLGEAKAALKKAKDILTALMQTSDPQQFDQKQLQQRLKYCEGLAASLQSRAGASAASASATPTASRLRQDHLAELVARRAQEAAEAEAREAAKRAEWEAEQARIEAARREMAAKLKAVEEKISRLPTGLRKPGRDSDGAISDAEGSPRKRRARKSTGEPKKRGRKPKADNAQEGEEGEEEEEEEEEDDDDDDDDSEPVVGRRSKVSKLSKEFISDDDDDELVASPMPTSEPSDEPDAPMLDAAEDE